MIVFDRDMQARLKGVLHDMDAVDLSHIMWALINYKTCPEPQDLDLFLDVLPSQLNDSEPAVSPHSSAESALLMVAAQDDHV